MLIHCSDIEYGTIDHDVKGLMFDFKPLKTEGVTLSLRSSGSILAIKVEPNSSLMYDYFYGCHITAKDIELNTFKNIINDVHDFVLNLLIKQGEHENLIKTFIHQYIPDEVLENIDLDNLIKSKLAINKFDL